MNENEHRRAFAGGAKDVELLDFRRAVGAAQGLAGAGASAGAIAGPAFADLHDVGLIDLLVVGRVELDLVVVEKDRRPLLVRRRPAIRLDPRRRQDDRRRVAVRTHAGKIAKHLSELKI